MGRDFIAPLDESQAAKVLCFLTFFLFLMLLVCMPAAEPGGYLKWQLSDAEQLFDLLFHFLRDLISQTVLQGAWEHARSIVGANKQTAESSELSVVEGDGDPA